MKIIYTIILTLYQTSVIAGGYFNDIINYNQCSIVGSNIQSVKVTNDNIISTFINYDLEHANILSILKHKEINDFFVQNKHNNSINDKIQIIKSNLDYFSFYIGEENSFVICALIQTSEFKSKTGISINTNKSDVEAILKQNINGNMAIIQSLEGFIQISVLFNNDKVDKITYKNTYID
ncbi:MAG: hypothetical protein OQK82_01885 [Candidatus Pacearchaeota archaeon]|nr:hypothetical protein [Candidatus Pacearchaeota archaeon]